MNSLLEIVKKNSSNETVTLNSNLENILEGLREGVVPSGEMPIKVAESEWQTLQNPERLSRSYQFDNYKLLRYFLDNLLDHQEKTYHHAMITVDHRIITIETYTHDVNAVTELDQELASFCDILFDDVKFYHTVRDSDDNDLNER